MKENSRTNQVGVYKENHLINNVFFKDTDLQFIFKKTERIVTAIYLVTNFFSVREPLKWDLRQSASRLLKSVMSYSKSPLSEREGESYSLSSNVLEMSSLLDIAYNSGFITQMNYEILNYEISKLSVTISEYNANKISSNKTLFNERTFHVEKAENVSEVKDESKKDSESADSFKRHIYEGFDTSKEKINNKGERVIKKDIKKRHSNDKRREMILEEVKRKGQVSVKDIAKIVTDCSEKTLQRELLAMVSEDVLKKEGERRWSRYSLKTDSK